MANNTKTQYTAFLNGEATDFTRSTKATVVAHVEGLRKGGEKGALEVRTQTGHVAFALAAQKTRNVTVHTKPFTKTVEVPKAIQRLVPKGYVVAYVRTQNDTAVLRSKKDRSDLIVTRLSTGEVLGRATTTREAGAIQTANHVKRVAANA
jgi:hypothetical protein